jgi:hypothetical protein
LAELLASFVIEGASGEQPDDAVISGFGRLANEHTGRREALVYQLFDIMQVVPSLKARPARMTYVPPTRSLAAIDARYP